MKPRVSMRAALAIVLLLGGLVNGCGGASQPAIPPSSAPPIASPVNPTGPARVSVVESDVGQQIVVNDAPPQLLIDDARFFELHVSPDKLWVVADVVLFSNLQVTRLYRWLPDQSAYGSPVNLSAPAWAEVVAEHGFALEEVYNARTRFSGWADHARAVVVGVSGNAPPGEIDQLVEIPLAHGAPSLH